MNGCWLEKSLAVAFIGVSGALLQKPGKDVHNVDQNIIVFKRGIASPLTTNLRLFDGNSIWRRAKQVVCKTTHKRKLRTMQTSGQTIFWGVGWGFDPLLGCFKQRYVETQSTFV